MTLKVVLDFDVSGVTAAGGVGGWSEVAWSSAGSLDGYVQLDAVNIPVVGTPLRNLIDVRLPLLSPTYAMTHIRVTDMNPANGERSIDLPQSVGTGQFGGVGVVGGVVLNLVPAAEIFAKLLLRMESGPTRRRNWWLGGIPESIVKPPTIYNPNPQWNQKLAAFSNLILTGGYGINGRPLRTAATPILTFVPDSFDATTAGLTPVPAGFPLTGAAGYVVLRGIKKPRGWNGIHPAYVDPSAPTVLRVGPTRRSMVTEPAFAPSARATVQYLVPVFVATDRVRPVRIDRRKIGRPFGESPGRR
jgi:hypothetical protein